MISAGLQQLSWRFLLWLGLGAGVTILAHGCHGDEDHELFGWSQPIVHASTPS